MEFFSWLGLTLVTLILGANLGFGMVARKIAVIWYHLVVIFLATLVLSLACIYVGQYLTFLSVRAVEILVGLGIMALAVVLFLSKPNYPGSIDLFWLTLALELDVGLLSFRYVQAYPVGYVPSFFLSLLLLGSIVGGMVLAKIRWFNWRIMLVYPYLPSMFLFLIGLLKVV